MSLSTHKLAAWLTAVLAALLFLPVSNASASIFEYADRDASQTVDFFDVAAHLASVENGTLALANADDVNSFTALVSIFSDRFFGGHAPGAQDDCPFGQLVASLAFAPAPTTSSSSPQAAKSVSSQPFELSIPNQGFPLITADDRASTVHMLARTLRGPPLA